MVRPEVVGDLLDFAEGLRGFGGNLVNCSREPSVDGLFSSISARFLMMTSRWPRLSCSSAAMRLRSLFLRSDQLARESLLGGMRALQLRDA